MKIQPVINNRSFGGNTFIVANSGKNKNVKFLYNQVCDLVSKNEVGAIFANDKIEISSASKKQTEKITKGLKEMGAEFLLDGKKPHKTSGFVAIVDE